MGSTNKTQPVPSHADNENGERSHLTREALADVDSARVLDHQDVQSWVEGLTPDATTPTPRPTPNKC